ncbi:MAG: deoxyguanosinetriphosphate triphosphohydrolase [Deltaproteobacteria bacterium]|nr:deoxyguanosinetriphosphate triphosphohydrolase [Deltaproteobacteria bacterium]
MNLREKAQDREIKQLSSFAAKSIDYLHSRDREEPVCEVRTVFQRDCHRIVHSKAFRRLRGKTQVFLWPKGDHYRTRLTHCMEVAQVARTISRALDLNEDLTEAIALGHDLGHTAFGHAGEGVLQKLHPNGFRHEVQSLRVVELLEKDGAGLNLTPPVRDGIVNHSKGAGPLLDVDKSTLPNTLEGQIVRLSDIVAYVHHDLDDAMRAKVISSKDLPESITKIFGDTHSARLTFMINNIITSTIEDQYERISMSRNVAAALEELRRFLYERVYYNSQVHQEFNKATKLIESLWDYFINDEELFYSEYWKRTEDNRVIEDDIRDFIAGMTDAYASSLFEKIFTPRRWYIY